MLTPQNLKKTLQKRESFLDYKCKHVCEVPSTKHILKIQPCLSSLNRVSLQEFKQKNKEDLILQAENSLKSLTKNRTLKQNLQKNFNYINK